MVTHMKTTVDLPDALFGELKSRAEVDGVAMRVILLEALQRELERRDQPRPTPSFSFPISTAAGWLNGDIALADAVEASYP